jgi:hypothetical protein
MSKSGSESFIVSKIINTDAAGIKRKENAINNIAKVFIINKYLLKVNITKFISKLIYFILRSANVFAPTLPSAFNPFDALNLFTAASVTLPKSPSAFPL